MAENYGSRHHQPCPEPQDQNVTHGVLCIKFETHTEPEAHSVIYDVLCIKNRESGQNSRKTGAPHRALPRRHLSCLGAWSAMPGRLPGDRLFAP